MVINDTPRVTLHRAGWAKQSRGRQVSCAPCEEKKKKLLVSKPGGGGDRRRSVVTLTPPLDKDLFHIHSNPETMTYQSLKSL